MAYTEIPNDLLLQAKDVLCSLRWEFERAEYQGSVQVPEWQMHQLLPFLKWLEYIDAVWTYRDSLATD